MEKPNSINWSREQPRENNLSSIKRPVLPLINDIIWLEQLKRYIPKAMEKTKLNCENQKVKFEVRSDFVDGIGGLWDNERMEWIKHI